MDGGRFLIAVVLMIAVVIITNIIFPPVPPPVETPEPPPAVVTEPPVAPTLPVETPPPDPAAIAAPAAAPVEEDTVFVRTPLFTMAFSTRGGTIVRHELNAYESHATEGPVQLADSAAGLLRHQLRLGDETVLDLENFAFTPDPAEDITLADGAAPDSLRLVHADTATGFGIELLFVFRPDDYVFDARARVTGAGDLSQRLLIGFGPQLPFHEWTPEEDLRELEYVVNNPQGIESVQLSKVETEVTEPGPLAWAALKNKYFVVAVLQDTTARPFGGLIARPAGENAADLTATLTPAANGVLAYHVYAGPQQFDRLSAVGNRFSEVNPIGWKWLRPVLQPLAKAITWILVEAHRVMGLGYGWLLIAFGFAVRLVLWPLNARAMRSQMKNMELQPRIKEIQTKYRSEPERMNKEMLKLYKEEGFNPMGGCLPMLIPFPVLITLFFVFQATIEFRGVPFLWLPDLARADPFYIIPVLMGASMFGIQWFSLRSTPDPTPQMKMMLWLMPGMMTVFFINFASGLNLYYTAMNVASLPQQMHIVRERKRWQAQRAGANKEVAPARG